MKYLYQNKYWSLNKDYNIDKILYLMVDRPNIVNNVNDFIWLNDKKQRHRDYEMPSIITSHYNNLCNLFWYVATKRHRKNDKPAVISRYGYKAYCINGNFIKDEVIK